jgi:hypothetical protein
MHETIITSLLTFVAVANLQWVYVLLPIIQIPINGFWSPITNGGGNSMFDVCFDCDTQLTEQKGTVYGYWGDTKIEFTALPRYSCSTCNTFYLDEKIAILTQEITRALTDINLASKVVDISNCYELLAHNTEKVYDLIRDGKIHLIELDNKIIIHEKDVRSLFSDDRLSLAARNNDTLPCDVQKEINDLCRK